jgi:uncharacterized protein (TIGR02271 family)
MISQEQANALTGQDVYARDGDKIGRIGQVWADAAGDPAWASVNTGLFGLKESLVPLQDADVTGDGVRVPYEKGQVKDAPNVSVDNDEPLTPDEVNQLYSHYGMSWDDSYRAHQAGSAATASGAADHGSGPASAVGRDTSGPTTDDAMTRSEERLNVSTQREQIGAAQLRKYVVTEQQQVSVPVSHDEVRVEREPITDANIDQAMDGPAISEEEHEVALHAERPVVDTEAVPVERVRLGKETVTEQQTVGGEVRKERIETDVPGQDRR